MARLEEFVTEDDLAGPDSPLGHRVTSPQMDAMPTLWHSCGMPRVRVSTTVDQELLTAARKLRSGLNDAALIDEALAALQRQHRAVEIDKAYEAYDQHPLDEQDEWGDLATFRKAAGTS